MALKEAMAILEQMKVRERRTTLRLRYAQTPKERKLAQMDLAFEQKQVRDAQEILDKLVGRRKP